MPLPITTSLQLLIDPSQMPNSNGDVLASFADYSGAGNNASCNGSPTFKANIANGKPAIRLGASDSDAIYGAFSSWGAGTGLTILLAAANYVSSGSGNSFAAAFAGTSDTGSGDLLYDNGVGAPASYHGGNKIICPGFGSSAVVFGVTQGPDGIFAICNGGVIALDSADNTASSILHYALGNRWLSGSSPSGFPTKYDVLMFAVFAAKLIAADFQANAIWMASRFGILPTNTDPGIANVRSGTTYVIGGSSLTGTLASGGGGSGSGNYGSYASSGSSTLTYGSSAE